MVVNFWLIMYVHKSLWNSAEHSLTCEIFSETTPVWFDLLPEQFRSNNRPRDTRIKSLRDESYLDSSVGKF